MNDLRQPVIATEKALMPAAVGVDIGCGIMAVKLPFKIDIIKNLSKKRLIHSTKINTINNLCNKP